MSASHTPDTDAMPVLDRLSALLERFRVRARLFHNGPLCGVSVFDAKPGRAFLHVLRRGEMEVRHRQAGMPKRVQVTEPTLLFYPRPVLHEFRNPPREGSDFTCAEIEFEGGEQHPLVRSLPSVLILPLAQVDGLDQSLQLLFSETARLRCGQRILADRLFEVVLIQLLRWLVDHPEVSEVDTGLMAGLADPRLARVLTAVQEAPGDAWTLDRMAALAGLSRSAFAARFKEVVGEPPAAYLADWRMSLAQQALRQGRPVKQIADELGYANPSALSRVFTQRVGQSPRAWKDALSLSTSES